jgi:tetratricopeptide (TPR) repeat protein
MLLSPFIPSRNSTDDPNITKGLEDNSITQNTGHRPKVNKDERSLAMNRPGESSAAHYSSGRDSASLSTPTPILMARRLGDRLVKQGKFEEAETVFKEIISEWGDIAKLERLEYFQDFYALGDLLTRRGKLEETEELCRTIISLQEGTIGKEHPDTLSSRERLAAIVMMQGKDQAAIDMLRDVWKVKRDTLGTADSGTLSTLRKIATALIIQGNSYMKAGNLATAEKLFNEALAIQSNDLGDYGSEKIPTLCKIAELLMEEARVDDAEHVLRQLLELQRQAFGDNDEQTHTTLGKLFKLELMRDLSMYGSGNELGLRGLLISMTDPSLKDILLDGSSLNPHVIRNKLATIAGISNVARKNGGLLAEQSPVLEKGGEIIAHSPDKNPGLTTFIPSENYRQDLHGLQLTARRLFQEGRLTEAEPLYKYIIASEEIIFGQKGMERLPALQELSEVLMKESNLAEAENIYKQILMVQEKTLGEADRATLSTLGNIAAVWMMQGRIHEAEALHCDTASLQQHILGDSDPDAVFTLTNFASIMSSQGKKQEAEKIRTYIESLQSREKGSAVNGNPPQNDSDLDRPECLQWKPVTIPEKDQKMVPTNGVSKRVEENVSPSLKRKAVETQVNFPQNRELSYTAQENSSSVVGRVIDAVNAMDTVAKPTTTLQISTGTLITAGIVGGVGAITAIVNACSTVRKNSEDIKQGKIRLEIDQRRLSIDQTKQGIELQMELDRLKDREKKLKLERQEELRKVGSPLGTGDAGPVCTSKKVALWAFPSLFTKIYLADLRLHRLEICEMGRSWGTEH